MQYSVLMVARVTVLAALVALLVVVTASSFFLWHSEKTVVSTHVPAVDVDGHAVQKAPAASPRRAGEHQPSTQRVGPDPATIIGLMMMVLGAQHGR